jgi:hypothetical protein
LKILIQWIASSIVGRKILYYTFNDKNFSNEALEFTNFIIDSNVTISQLYSSILKIIDFIEDNKTPNTFMVLKKILNLEK